jgi:hypothetical protein
LPDARSTPRVGIDPHAISDADVVEEIVGEHRAGVAANTLSAPEKEPQSCYFVGR